MAHLVEIIKHDETKMQENLFPIATNNKREREREREREAQPSKAHLSKLFLARFHRPLPPITIFI